MSSKIVLTNHFACILIRKALDRNNEYASKGFLKMATHFSQTNSLEWYSLTFQNVLLERKVSKFLICLGKHHSIIVNQHGKQIADGYLNVLLIRKYLIPYFIVIYPIIKVMQMHLCMTENFIIRVSFFLFCCLLGFFVCLFVCLFLFYTKDNYRNYVRKTLLEVLTAELWPRQRKLCVYAVLKLRRIERYKPISLNEHFRPKYSVRTKLIGCLPIKCPGGRLNKKDGLTRYGDSHVKDKTS